MFSGLSSLVIEEVTGRDEVIVVRARTAGRRAWSLPAAHDATDGPGRRVTRRLAGRAGAGLLAALGIPLSRHTALRILLRLPLPELALPRVLGVDDFALRRGQVYATILIDAQTGQRVDFLASRKAGVLEAWLRDHPGVEVVCRDGSGAYGEAVRRALPGLRCRPGSGCFGPVIILGGASPGVAVKARRSCPGWDTRCDSGAMR